MNTSYRLGWLTIQLTFSTVLIHLTQSNTIFFYTFMITRLSNWFTIFPLNYYYTYFTICSFSLLNKFMKFICSLQPYPNAYFSYLVLPMQRNYPCDIIPILSHKSSAYSIKWVVKIIEVFFLHSKYYKMYYAKYSTFFCGARDPILNLAHPRIQLKGCQLVLLQLIVFFASLPTTHC